MTTATATTDELFHPVSAIFPLLDGEEFETLVDSVRDKGLINSIWRDNDGLIIDGRNRYRACLEAGVSPHYKQWDGEGSLTDFVVAQNIERRHLNATQKALLAKKLEPFYAKENPPGRPPKGERITQKIEGLFNDNDNTAAARAAKRTGSNRQYVADLKKMEQESPEVYARVESGDLELAAAKKEIKMGVHYSSDTDEWYTPPEIVAKVVECLGTIDLDPCSPAEPTIPAKRFYTKADDGLARDWKGTVYMNPPYGREIGQWAEKLVSEYKVGRTKEALALVPSRTDTEWFRLFANYAFCFVAGRLRFSRATNSAPFPSALIYLGKNIDNFHVTFADTGEVLVRFNAQRKSLMVA